MLHVYTEFKLSGCARCNLVHACFARGFAYRIEMQRNFDWSLRRNVQVKLHVIFGTARTYTKPHILNRTNA